MKRRSNTSKQHEEEPTLFLDRNLGKEKLANRLRQDGLKIECHDSWFPQNEKDPVWLRETGIREWVVISPDDKIRKEAPSVAAILEGKGRVFLLPHNKIPAEQWAGTVLNNRPKLMRTIRKNPGPFIARLNANGITGLTPITQELVEKMEKEAYERLTKHKAGKTSKSGQ